MIGDGGSSPCHHLSIRAKSVFSFEQVSIETFESSSSFPAFKSILSKLYSIGAGEWTSLSIEGSSSFSAFKSIGDGGSSRITKAKTFRFLLLAIEKCRTAVTAVTAPETAFLLCKNLGTFPQPGSAVRHRRHRPVTFQFTHPFSLS